MIWQLKLRLQALLILSTLTFLAGCNNSYMDIHDVAASPVDNGEVAGNTQAAGLGLADTAEHTNGTTSLPAANTALNTNSNTPHEITNEVGESSEANVSSTGFSDDDTSETNNIPTGTLSGAVAPFEKVNFQIDNSIEFITISYRDSTSGKEVFQPSFKNSEGDFTILAIPLSMDGVNTYEVSNKGVSLGTIDVLPNSMIAKNSTPGQYSLTVLTTIINGLKQELDAFTEDSLRSQPGPEQNDKVTKIVPVQRAITSYQELISMVDYAVSNGTSIVDPATNSVLLEMQDLETLDGLFHHIISRYSSDPTFTSHALSLLQTEGAGFNLIFSAIKHQLEDWDGIAALASLKMYTTSSTQNQDLKSLNNILDIVKAALLPAILANELYDIRDPTSDETHINESVRLFTKTEAESTHSSNFIFKNALSALTTVSESIL